MVNIPTTLVSQLMGSGEMSLAQAQAQVAEALGLRPEALDVIEESIRTPFSHLAFLLTIGQESGFNDFSVANLLPQAQVPSSEFRSNAEVLSLPWGSIEPELVALLDETRQTQLVLAEDAEPRSSPFGLLAAIGTGLGEKVVDNAEDTILTWVGHLLGFNYGINGEFEKINEKLDALASGIDALSAQLANSTFQTAADVLNIPINNLQTLQNQAEQAAEDNELTNVPRTVPSETEAFLTSLGSFAAASTLLDLQTACLGLNNTTNLVTLGAAISLEPYNFSPVDEPFTELLGMPVRSNKLLTEALQAYQTYAGYQTLAANYLAENAHSPANSLDMVEQIRSASDTVHKAAQSMALQRQQLPRFLPGDDVLVDLQYGIMWYLPIQDRMTFDEARSFALSFSLVGSDGVTYGAWHLPTKEEFQTLQTRGRLVKRSAQDPAVAKNSDKGEGDYGRVTQGVSALGFSNAQTFNSDGNVWMTYYYNNDDFPPQGLTRDYFRLNHESANMRGASSDDKHPVILCRSIVDSNSALAGSSVVPITYPVYNEVGPDLQRTQPLQSGELAALGQLTAIGVPTLDSESSVPTCDLTYEVTLGGKFRAGTSSVGQGSDVRTATFQKDISSSLSHTVEPQSASTTLAQVLAYSIVEAQNLFVPFFQVSNFDGTPGQVSYLTDPGASPGQVTVQVQSFGPSLAPLQNQGSVTVSPSNRTLTDLLIVPRNVLFPSDNPGQIQAFLAVGFYSDGTVEDLTQDATWSLTGPNGPVPDTAARLSTDPLGSLEIVSGDVPDFTLNAAMPNGGPTDSTAIKITTF